MWGDLDALGIVFYPRYYEWMDACGHLFFESVGLRLKDLWDARGILFGLMQTSCTYLGPAYYHDDLEIVTSACELRGKTVTLRHTIRRALSTEALVQGRETRVCMDCRDPKNLHGMAIPQDIAQIIETVL